MMQREGHSGLWNPQDNLPENLKDVKEQFHVVKDEKGYALTHYVLAERLMQVEAKQIHTELNVDGVSDTLIYILEGGFRGYHKFTADQLKAEWLDGANDKWFQLYEDGELPWEIYEDDPLAEDE
tara:strand:+ start:940 stop:1311 length:372 start_codon:yes stop_codon:yes gene_type:complete